jgi:para-nitrobenzyl esterase
MPQARQSILAGLFGPGDLSTAEACLSLNIWTPGLNDPARPVMVFIHGGAFRTGTGASPMYDGAALARRGNVVVVTINYRLGALGFLYDPSLPSANVGLLDQIAALQWVRREIVSFGGDAENVTIFGESAGGKSVELLLTMPEARGLFHKAIAESTYAPPLDPESALAYTAELVSELGLSGTDLVTLQDLPLSTLMEAQQAILERQAAVAAATGVTALGGFVPTIDGQTIPRHPVAALAAGVARDVPLLLGTNLDESRLAAAMAPAATLDEDTVLQRVAAQLGAIDGEDARSIASQALEVYGASLRDRGEPATPADILYAITCDRTFRYHSIRVAEAQSQHQAKTFMYLFTWKSPAMAGLLGAFHTLELPFVFGNFDTGLGDLAGPGEAADRLSTTMQDAWLSFARAGDPGHGELTQWPPYRAPERRTMVLGAQCQIEAAPMERERLLWRSLEDRLAGSRVGA